MKIKLIILSMIFLCPVLLKAQGLDEIVLDLSQPYSGGTARMLGIGGSKVSLGGDIGNIYMNPAGLGFYNSSEWSISPSLNYIGSSTEYLNDNTNDGRLNFNIANAGIVFNRTKGIVSEDKWRGGSFAFSLNRINTFNRDITYQGNNNVEDILDYAVEEGSYYNYDDDITQLLLEVGAVGDFFVEDIGQDSISFNGGRYPVEGLYKEDGDIFFVDRNIYDLETGELAIPGEEFPVQQREEYSSKGSQYAASISYGGNYDDRVYFGAGLNVMAFDKEITRVYTERPKEADLETLTFSDTYRLLGNGVNLNLGLILRPVETLLVGFSYTTPTWYGLEESRDFEMTAQYVDETITAQPITYLPYFYNLSMPSKIRGGLTYFFGKSGFISADVETSRINNARFSGNDFNFNPDNNLIEREFSRVVNAGIGGEYRLDMFRFRAGMEYSSDPTQAEGIDFDRMMYGFGAGLRKQNFFIDFAYNIYQSTRSVSPYPTAQLAVSDILNSMATVTIGFSM